MYPCPLIHNALKHPHTTRWKLHTYLKGAKGLALKAIAAALNITVAQARGQLYWLMKGNLVFKQNGLYYA